MVGGSRYDRSELQLYLNGKFDNNFELCFQLSVKLRILSTPPHRYRQSIGLTGGVILPSVHVTHDHKHGYVQVIVEALAKFHAPKLISASAPDSTGWPKFDHFRAQLAQCRWPLSIPVIRYQSVSMVIDPPTSGKLAYQSYYEGTESGQGQQGRVAPCSREAG